MHQHSEAKMDAHNVETPRPGNYYSGMTRQTPPEVQTPPRNSSWITNIQDAALAVVKHAPSGNKITEAPHSVTPPSHHYIPAADPGVHAFGTSLPARPSYVANKSKSASIPISPKSIRRTASENQLSEDEAMADYKDYIVYSRIVNGISRQNSQRKDVQLLYENQLCLGNIMRTRQYNVDDDSEHCLHKKLHNEHYGGYPELMSEQYGLHYQGRSHHHHLHQPYSYHQHNHHLTDDSTEHAEVFVLDM